MTTRVRGARRGELRTEMARRFRAGQPRITIAGVAESFGCRQSTVRRLLSEAGVRSRRALIGYDAETVTVSLAARRRLGVPVQQLAADTGLTEQFIRDRLRAAGTPPARWRRRGDLSMGAGDLVGAYDSGVDIAVLADYADSSYGTVRRILLDAGVQLRPPRRGSTSSRS